MVGLEGFNRSLTKLNFMTKKNLGLKDIQGVSLVLSKVICFVSSFILPTGYYGRCHFFTETGRFCYIDCKKFKCIVIIFKISLCFQPLIRNIGKNTKKTQR